MDIYQKRLRLGMVFFELGILPPLYLLDSDVDKVLKMAEDKLKEKSVKTESCSEKEIK